MEEKKKSNIGIILLVIVLLCAAFAGGYFVNEKGLIGGEKEAPKEEKEEEKKSSKEIESNALIDTLVDRVAYVVDHTKEEMKVSEMNQTTRDAIAASYFTKFEQMEAGENQYSVPELAVKYGYDSIFGVGTYKPEQDISTSLCASDLKYDSKNRKYTYGHGGCGGTSTEVIIAEPVKVVKEAEELKVNVAYLYFSMNDVYSNYKDEQASSNSLGTIKSLFGDDLLLSSVRDNVAVVKYIKDNSDKLEQYMLDFEQDENGFYKYLGYEKIK